ncbi:hypothetical protein B566_EDAN002366 [Ephemera danica]|nr:hypothetical protein B566_EDAN002366 [Ephemera danica]
MHLAENKIKEKGREGGREKKKKETRVRQEGGVLTRGMLCVVLSPSPPLLLLRTTSFHSQDTPPPSPPLVLLKKRKRGKDKGKEGNDCRGMREVCTIANHRARSPGQPSLLLSWNVPLGSMSNRREVHAVAAAATAESSISKGCAGRGAQLPIPAQCQSVSLGVGDQFASDQVTDQTHP